MVAWHLSHKKFGTKPWDVQIATLDAKYITSPDRWGHFLEQGLGKTPTTLNEFVHENERFAHNIVFCPNSFKMDWTRAPEAWGIGQVKTGMWPRDPLPGLGGEPMLYAMNYEALRSAGGEQVLDLMRRSRKKIKITFDEGSRLKNFKSDTGKVAMEVAKHTDQVTVLNGTPIAKDVMDLFPQLKVLGQLIGWNPYKFRNRFAIMGGYMGKQVKRGLEGIQNAEELHEIQSLCSFRALKKDWRDLPPKNYVPMQLEMTDKQWKHYQEMLEDFYTIAGDGEEYEAALVLTQMDKLRQITSGVLIDGDRYSYIEEAKNNPKIKAALDVYDSGPGKMVICYQYKATGQLIFDAMEKAKLKPVWLKGQMGPEDFFQQKQEFNENPERRVCVGQMDAIHMGHDLIGSEGNDRCTRMFFHDNTFSLLVRSQVEDRPHRGEQDQVVNYYTPTMSPIDVAQQEALEAKASLASYVVDTVRRIRHGNRVP